MIWYWCLLILLERSSRLLQWMQIHPNLYYLYLSVYFFLLPNCVYHLDSGVFLFFFTFHTFIFDELYLITHITIACWVDCDFALCILLISNVIICQIGDLHPNVSNTKFWKNNRSLFPGEINFICNCSTSICHLLNAEI